MNKASRALFWDGSIGLAFFDGVHCELRSRPRIQGLDDLDQIDYAPLVGQRMLVERGGAWRGMRPVEDAAVDAALHRMANAVRHALC
jgi:hypothetical protein